MSSRCSGTGEPIPSALGPFSQREFRKLTYAAVRL